MNMNFENFIQEYNAALRVGVPFDIPYTARLLLPGSDAAIIVNREGVTISINDAPVPGDHPMNAFIDEHELEIRDVTSADLGLYREIVMVGRWHNHGTEMQTFEPYLVCKSDDEGHVSIAKYEYEFFGYGRGGHRLELNSGVDGWSAHRVMMAVTARLTDYSSMSLDLPKNLGLPQAQCGIRRQGLGCRV